MFDRGNDDADVHYENCGASSEWPQANPIARSAPTLGMTQSIVLDAAQHRHQIQG